MTILNEIIKRIEQGSAAGEASLSEMKYAAAFREISERLSALELANSFVPEHFLMLKQHLGITWEELGKKIEEEFKEWKEFK